MKLLIVLLTTLTLLMPAVHASDWAAQRKQRDAERAAYWKARGYNFDPQYMTAYSMDRKVKDIERAKYWKQKGYNFDPDYMTAYSMDRKVKDIERAKYWKQKGYDFDPDFMTAYSMDRKVKDIKRAKHWKEKGYNFDPDYMTSWSMDQAVKKQEHPQDKSSNQSLDTSLAQRAALLQAYQETLRKQQALSRLNNDALLSFDVDEENDLDPLLETDNLQPQLPRLAELPRIGSGLSQSEVDLGDKTKRGTYLGQWSANEFDPDSISNPFGAGNQFNANSINNEFGKYGSEFSPNSPRNPFATDTPKLYDSQGNYRGKLSNNQFDPDSISNPFGRYGNPFSPDSVNNQFGAGNPFSPDSPNNPFGQGLSIYGDE